MEILLVIAIIMFALAYVLDKATTLLKQLKTGSAKLTNGFEAKLSIVPVDNKKSEECARHTNSTNNHLE